MNRYQVVRRFGPHQPGTVLEADGFASSQRIAQLIDQRKITALEASGATQPTVASLLEATVRQVGALAEQVQDAAVLEAALAQETRESARKVLEARLAEMGNRNESSH